MSRPRMSGSPWPHRQLSVLASMPGWPPHPPPRRCKQISHRLHCSLLKENSTSQTFVWRELDHHLPTNEARLCKQREARRQVVCLSGRLPRSWHPRCLRGSVHMFQKHRTPSSFGTSPGDVCLSGWESPPRAGDCAALQGQSRPLQSSEGSRSPPSQASELPLSLFPSDPAVPEASLLRKKMLLFQMEQPPSFPFQLEPLQLCDSLFYYYFK